MIQPTDSFYWFICPPRKWQRKRSRYKNIWMVTLRNMDGTSPVRRFERPRRRELMIYQLAARENNLEIRSTYAQRQTSYKRRCVVEAAPIS